MNASPASRRRIPAAYILAAWLAGILALALAFFYFFGGWTLSEPADLTICNGDEPQTLDPAIITGQLEGRLALALFEGLTTRNAKGDIVPGMAESWQISPDGLTYTFHLRSDAKWSNGMPLTAYDFLNSWERTLNPATASQYAYQLYYLVNGEAYGTGKLKDFSQVGVKAPDARTLIVTLTHPTAFFLELTSFQTLCPVYLPGIEKYGNNWMKPPNLVSNGPYCLKVWRLNDYILLEANPYYWRKVAFQRIKVLPTSNATTCLNLFSSGKLDLILDKNSVPASLVDKLREKPYFHANPFGGTAFVRYNVKRKPFDDLRVRKALALAIDKEDIVRKITRAGEPVAETLVPPGNKDYIPPLGPKYNPEEARKLLAEAGYPGGKGFPNVQMLYAKRSTPEQVAIELQALWQQELGITSITLRGQEWKVYLNTQSLIDFDLCLSAWVGDYNDPQTFLDMFVTDGGNNLTGWSNPTYDHLLDQSQAIPDPAQRMKLLQEMETILVDQDMPIVPLYYYVGISLYRNEKVAGFEPNFVDDHRWGVLYPPEKKP